MASDKKGAIQRGATLVFHDEGGFSLKPNLRRTWAPRGQTPIVRHKFNWERVHAVGALACCPDGSQAQLLVYLQETAINAEAIIAYLSALHEHIPGLIILLWDGLPSHRSKKVAAYLAANQDWLEVERFPGYAPELNPVEYVWSCWKGKDLSNSGPDDTLEIVERLLLAQERVGQEPDTLYGFLVASTLYEKQNACTST